MAEGFKLFEDPVMEPIPGLFIPSSIHSCMGEHTGLLCVTQPQPAVVAWKGGTGMGQSSGSHKTILKAILQGFLAASPTCTGMGCPGR